MDKDHIIEIEGLYINFYTKGGVVYAIDGMDLKIEKGETLGLVGESGCGKTVTANSIMRLIPSPPGKIEKGKILFSLPASIRAQFDALMDLEAGSGPDDPSVKKAREQFESEMKSNALFLPSLQDKYLQLKKSMVSKGLEDPGTKALLDENREGLSQYDILRLPEKDLRRIRGNSISMIFQEPMSSLNPVFTTDEQISEIILLHERRDLATAVLDKMVRDEKARKEGGTAKREVAGDGTLRCSKCGAVVGPEEDHCPQCKFIFKKGGRSIFTPVLRSLYKRMVDDPNDGLLRALSKIPLVKRYEKPMRREATARSIEMLKKVKVPDPVNVSKSYPYELSGGMQQRVMIAMALACKPQLLIADEPTTALDVTIQAQILKLMRDLQKELGTTILMITHNLGIIAEICDRVGVMYAGNIVELASNEDLFKEPLHPYTQGLLSAIPRINIDLPRLATIEGNVPNLLRPPSGCRFHPRCPYSMDICSQAKPEMIEVKPGHKVACHLLSEVGS